MLIQLDLSSLIHYSSHKRCENAERPCISSGIKSASKQEKIGHTSQNLFYNWTKISSLEISIFEIKKKSRTLFSIIFKSKLLISRLEILVQLQNESQLVRLAEINFRPTIFHQFMKVKGHSNAPIVTFVVAWLDVQSKSTHKNDKFEK